MASLQHIAPIFPTADMDAMRAHYEALGFAVHVHGGGYGTAARDGIRIHFKLVPDMGPAAERGAAYLGVDDATRLHAEWRAAAVGETSDLFDPGFGVLGGGAHRRRREPAALRLARRALTPAQPDGSYTCVVMKATAFDLLLT